MTSETITVAVAQEFVVRLKSTPTTGYVWEVQKLPEGIQFSGSDYEKPGGDIKPGAPVTQVFRFKSSKSRRVYNHVYTQAAMGNQGGRVPHSDSDG